MGNPVKNKKLIEEIKKQDDYFPPFGSIDEDRMEVIKAAIKVRHHIYATVYGFLAKTAMRQLNIFKHTRPNAEKNFTI